MENCMVILVHFHRTIEFNEVILENSRLTQIVTERMLYVRPIGVVKPLTAIYILRVLELNRETTCHL